MRKYSTVVIGGGAAGICAAISKGRRRESVIICEKTFQLGKKILASGDGRCNLLNEDFSEEYYNSNYTYFLKSIFCQVGKHEILDFFRGLGLEVYSKAGRIFPITNQAATVLKVLEIELRRLSVPVEFNFNCSGLLFTRNNIVVLSKTGLKIECQKAIITGGGKTYPAFGSDGSMYEVAKSLNHSIIKPVPSVVPLVIRDNLCQILQGQRIFAVAKSFVEGKKKGEASGEVLFTKYGLSGTCILDISEELSIALNRQNKTDVFVSLDMVPFMDNEKLKCELGKRMAGNIPAEEILVGILPNKFGNIFKDLFYPSNLDTVVDSLKNRHFAVIGTRGWNEAEFTCGGINVNEVKPVTLESKLKEGVYFAGEILDINGKRGGYNLGWAWASGLVAGQTN